MGLRVEEQVPLAAHTTLGVGGPARLWVEATCIAEVRQALELAGERALPLIVLGAGSNVVIADRGLDAVVLRPRIRTLALRRETGDLWIRAGAGVDWQALVDRAVSEGAGGVECLAGIPGEVGAAPVQNIGAYGQEIADTLVSVHAVDRNTGAETELHREECGFGYRDSRFKSAAKDRFVIVGVELRLPLGAPPKVTYPELERALAATKAAPSLASVCRAVVELRRAKSMVLDDADENRRSAGSFFVNPTLTSSAFTELRELAAAVLAPGETVPHHRVGPDAIKVPAAWLIERAGLVKGTRRGPVGLSTRHTLAVVNRGGATAQQIVAFAAEVRARVRDRFSVTLSPEPQLLGFEPRQLEPLCS
jgi:UDP-N-acetylmuramate dehydrogenase